MALQKLTLKPGVNREGTSYANENGFYSSDKVRFRSGYAEKIGGWRNIGSYTYDGIARSIWAWTSLSSENLIGLGTSQKFYISYGTQYYDITPIRTTLSASTIATTTGSPKVTITVTGNEATIGSFFTLTAAYGALNADITATDLTITISGVSGTFPASGNILIDNEQIYYTSISGPVSGVYTLTIPSTTGRGANGTFSAAHLAGATVISLEAITVGGVDFVGQQQVIESSTNSISINTTSSPTTATSGASTYYAIFDINAGGGIYTSSFGWGSGTWGAGAWGSSTITTSSLPFRLWSQSNYNQDLIFAQRYGAIYWWTKDISTYPRAITINTQANNQTSIATAKTVTTAQWISNASSIYVEDTTMVDTGCVVTGTGIPTGSYVAATWDFSNTIPLIDPSTGSPATLTNAQTTLNGAINATVLSLTLTDGSQFPSSDGVVLIGTEQIFYSTRVGNVLTVPTGGRGYNGTTAASHNNLDPVYNYTPTQVTFSYAGRHIPVKTLLVATSSQNAFTIAFGATPYDPYTFSTAANFDPLLIRWSDQDKPYDWVPTTMNQSGEQRLSNGSIIVTAVNTRQEILVWTDTALYSMQYLGPPYVWGINLMMDNLSIASPNAAITVNNITYWMGVDRFYQYTGKVDTLPCTLRQFIFGNINRAQLSQICCGTNEGFNEVWWFYPSATSLVNDRYVIFNHLENTWTYGTMNRTAWLDTQLEQNPLGAFSTERTYTLLSVATTDTTVQLAESSSLPPYGTILIDSEQISYANNNYGSNLLEECVRGVNNTAIATHAAYARVTCVTPNQLMFHEFGYDDGAGAVTLPIEAYIESADFDIGDGMNFAYVWRILPDLTFEGSTVTSPQCQLTVKVRQNSGAAYTVGTTDSQSVVRTATYPVEQYTGQVYTRVRGRQMAFRMSSTDLGVFWQMGMMRIDIRPDGRR